MITFEEVGVPSNQVQLRDPEFGNTGVLSQGLVVHKAMSGVMYTYIEETGVTIMTMEFNTIKKADLDALITFMIDTFGEDIRFVDWDNQAWEGRLSSSELEDIIGKGSQSCASHNFGLQFEGQQVT